MYTIKLSILPFFSLWLARASKKTPSSFTPKSNPKKSTQKTSSEASSTKNELSSSPNDNNSIYYLPVHLM